MLKENVLEKRSHVAEVAYFDAHELAVAKKYNTTFHRSKGSKTGDHPFASYMVNKKWILEEEMNNHILRFQQVKKAKIFNDRDKILFRYVHEKFTKAWPFANYRKTHNNNKNIGYT